MHIGRRRWLEKGRNDGSMTRAAFVRDAIIEAALAPAE